MFRTFISPSLLALLAVNPAFAETTYGDWTVDGDIGAYYQTEGAYSRGLATSDLDLRYDFGGFGVAISAISYALEGYASTSLYGGGTYTFGNGGRITVGAPRSAYDGYGASAVGRSDAGLALSSQLGGGIGILTQFSMNGNLDDYGIRYDSASDGVFSYSGSYHHVDDIGEDVLALGARYESGAFVVSGGFERVGLDNDVNQAAKLQASYSFGQFEVGAYLSQAKFLGSTFNYKEVSGLYHPTDRWALGLAYGEVNTGLSGARLTMGSVDYEIVDHVSATLGVTKFDYSPDVSYQMGVKFTF